MEILLAISLAAGLFSMAQPSTGTYTVMQQGGSIVRMDTRTGTMERCSIVGARVSCEEIVAAK